MKSPLCDPSVIVIAHLDAPLRVETLSFEEAAEFDPQEWFVLLKTFRLGRRIVP